uniref:Dihydrolipoamide acetyltransferase component of pyruvate dehydrogenase complex n=1 Tax=Ilyomonas limi TaxID=2575867 RepID=A0A4U3L6H7_9BACT|nr:dihydrolipoamide acetyltransferase family protein [Ilyomonas limi]TKK70835.1 2-oxo acid dehydrogenase subunit E2 [Ilyomonas limi]
MAVVDLVMPKLGESIMEATILKWHKKAGDTIENDETVLDIATDKVDSEVPSTAAGTITELLYKENDVVPIGAVIARIDTNNTQQADDNQAASPTPYIQQSQQHQQDEEALAAAVPYVPQPTPVINKPAAAANRFYSPLVLNIANSEGISMQELENIPGTGNESRVTKKDMLAYVERKKAGKAPQQQVQQSPQQSVPATPTEQPKVKEEAPAQAPQQDEQNYGGNVEIIEMDRMRRLIAKHMVDSKHTSPHVTSFSEADVTNMVLWREKVKTDFEKRENAKITFTPLIIDCIARIIKRFPIINSSVDGDRIIIKKDINIGMAAAMPTGNLIVPIIKNADYLNLVGLSKMVSQLAYNARNGKLKPDDTQGGTFTFTNVGTFGSLMGTPIINQPQVAILAAGAIKKRPVVIENPAGDTIGIRHMMYLSLSYDHRIIDGSTGASFLTAVANELESWDVNRQLI